MICIQCGHKVDHIFFCDACGALQPFSDAGIHYFDLLGVPKTFDLDEGSLTKAYFEAQKKFHPDRFVTKPHERAFALDYSALINEAYEVLKKPLLRARYLLKIEGNIGGTHAHLHEAEILEALFVLQETLSDIEDLKVLDRFEKDVQAQLSAEYGLLKTAFAKNEHARAHESIIKVGYFEKIMREIKMMRAHLEG